MKKSLLGPAALCAFALATVPTLFVLGSRAEAPAPSDEAKTLQMIASYRSWGKANPQPIVVSLDSMAISG